MSANCALCNIVVKSVHSSPAFCCLGCQSVYQILANQKALDSFREHPLFLQAVKSGLISNPQLLESLSSKKDEQVEYVKFHFEIQDLWCPSCTDVIRWVLLKEKGIKSCTVDYCTDLATLEYAPRFISKEKALTLIKNLGYRPLLFSDPCEKAISQSLYTRFIVSAFFSMNIMMFAYPLYIGFAGEYGVLMAWFSFFCSLPVITYAAWPIWRRLYHALAVRILGMELLVGIGVLAGLSLSIFELMQNNPKVYFDSITVIVTFMLLGKILESKAKWKAKEALIQLTRSLPKRGRKIFEDGSTQFVPINDISEGDLLQVLTGERVVADGVVESGEASSDESHMTGESKPVFKMKGSLVLAGSIIQQGNLNYRSGGNLKASALYQIIDIVQMDIAHKSSYVRAGDLIAKWFVPLILVVALGVFIFGDILSAMAVLLISCPCAIGIAAPLAESYLLNNFAQKGALVRNRGCLAFLGKETRFIFDKTGTVTEGQFRVINGLENFKEEELAAIKGISLYSHHPIAVALSLSISQFPQKPDKVEEIIGNGMEGAFGENIYKIGSANFVGVEEIENSHTIVYVSKNNILLGHLELGDKVRQEASSVIKQLALVQPLLVSGDSASAVGVVARACGFKNFHASCSPLEKKTIVENLKKEGHIVAMLGDGINDAPALAAAQIGMAVFSASDISAQTADILLTIERLEIIPEIMQLAKKGQRIIKQNLFWAFFYNIIGVGFAAFGLLTPLFAAIAMIVSSFIVLFNAQRLFQRI